MPEVFCRSFIPGSCSVKSILEPCKRNLSTTNLVLIVMFAIIILQDELGIYFVWMQHAIFLSHKYILMYFASFCLHKLVLSVVLNHHQDSLKLISNIHAFCTVMFICWTQQYGYWKSVTLYCKHVFLYLLFS